MANNKKENMEKKCEDHRNTNETWKQIGIESINKTYVDIRKICQIHL